MKDIKLTAYSHGAGCGCKISPEVLDLILNKSGNAFSDPRLLIGNQTNDDAALYDLGNGQAVISTTDFFMPIVDDPYDFGAIAATNAISDVYAMGGKPIMAIAILGWPINTLSPEVAGEVLNGGRDACTKAGISLAGGHSIDSPEPIFGLAVTGVVNKEHIKRNDTALEGDRLFLTKKLGIGMVTTAQKKGVALPDDLTQAIESMQILNKLGETLGKMPEVHALTDVTGFGLAGHLIEMCEGSGLSAQLDFENLPLFPFVEQYLKAGCIPGGTQRNWKSYGHKVGACSDFQRLVLADPQTSGGLLISVSAGQASAFQQFLESEGYYSLPIGKLVAKASSVLTLS